MEISEKYVDEFIKVYKEEYGVELERAEGLRQAQALVTLVRYMLPIEERENELSRSE
jgi:hypothetical protein